jgi:hypothetical protein
MSVIGWLLEGDPAIRWQVLHDLTNASPDDVAAERARVEQHGWGPFLPRFRQGLCWRPCLRVPIVCPARLLCSPGR